ncbi:MAG: nitroreductase [Ectothiorhodospiraceae bacterium]|nr:nitroreductase [Ectothiorhodospiraceae bacterium]
MGGAKLREDDWQALVAAAILAPSSHNTQPWLFRPTRAGLDLLADERRALPVNDPDDRELTMSCGCALMNLRVAAAARGLTVDCSLLPDPTEPALLARLSLAAEHRPAPADADLAPAIATRRTCRRRFADRPVPAEVVARVVASARVEGTSLHPVTGEARRREIARLVGEGDAVQWADPSWRRELAAWMHPGRDGDGLALPTLATPLAQAVVRTFDMGGGVAARDRDLTVDSPLLAVLGTAGDTRRDWLLAGQALERVLLTARRLGLQASFLNQPVEVAALRPRLARAVPCEHPQILLRAGYPTGDIPPSPRRALDAVVLAARTRDEP